MACGAIADSTVAVGLADAVALFATAGHCGVSFQLHKWVWRPARSSRLIGLGKIHLLRSKALLSINRAPRRSGMTAVQILLVNGFMAGAAISRGQFCGNYKSVMIVLLLADSGLVAVQAVDAFSCMHTEFVFVDD
jgi:hypothetical protein